MRTIVFCYGVVLVAASFSASIAEAQYRCNPAPSPLDRAACLAAEQGPAALRHYIERMRAINTPLYFYDYVNEARAQAWDEQERREQGAKNAETPSVPEIAQAAPK